MKLFGKIITGLEKNMSLRLTRQGMINANISNADTPGYRPVDLIFKDQLARYMEATDDRLDSTSPYHVHGTPAFDDVEGEAIQQAGENSPDKNAVDLDRQMAELSANSFNYRASAKITQKKLALLKYVINETR